jgi:chromosome segregation ATPase
LKSLVEETGEYFQTISSNNLLPYENLQTLKTIYDNMQEDFLDKLRMIDELLEDLIQDNDKWIKFNTELQRLETLFKEINSLFESKSFGEKSLEEKQQILDVSVSHEFY